MDEEIRSLLQTEEMRGEQRANYARLLLLSLFLVFFIGFYVKSERHYFAGYVILADLLALLLYAIGLRSALDRGLYHPSLKYVSTAADTACITVMAIASVFLSSGPALQGWISNIAVFLLFIALSGLRFSPGLCFFTGAVTALEFLLLNLFVIIAGGEPLPLPQLVTIAVLLIAAGGLIALTARTAQRLIVQASLAERQRLQLAAEADHARQLAITDDLTGLHNRRHFMDELKRELIRCGRYDKPFAVLTIDVDFFKQVNDTLGHLNGDLVLRQVADALRKESRETDVVARYGGDEFGLVLYEASQEQAEVAAERLRLAVRRLRFAADGVPEFHVSLSIGLASFPTDAADVEGLLRAADHALYQAKALGRDRVVCARSTANIKGLNPN